MAAAAGQPRHRRPTRGSGGVDLRGGAGRAGRAGPAGAAAGARRCRGHPFRGLRSDDAAPGVGAAGARPGDRRHGCGVGAAAALDRLPLRGWAVQSGVLRGVADAECAAAGGDRVGGAVAGGDGCAAPPGRGDPGAPVRRSEPGGSARAGDDRFAGARVSALRGAGRGVAAGLRRAGGGQDDAVAGVGQHHPVRQRGDHRRGRTRTRAASAALGHPPPTDGAPACGVPAV